MRTRRIPYAGVHQAVRFAGYFLLSGGWLTTFIFARFSPILFVGSDQIPRRICKPKLNDMEGRLPTDIPQELVHGPMLMLISVNSPWYFPFVLHPRRSHWRFGLVVFPGTWFLFSLLICAPTSTTLSLGMYLASMLHLLSTFVILSFVPNLHTRTRTSWKFPFTSLHSPFFLLLLRTRLTSSCLTHTTHTHTHTSTRSLQSHNMYALMVDIQLLGVLLATP